jgi:hypothetical protein
MFSTEEPESREVVKSALPDEWYDHVIMEVTKLPIIILQKAVFQVSYQCLQFDE